MVVDFPIFSIYNYGILFQERGEEDIMTRELIDEILCEIGLEQICADESWRED